MQLKRYYAVDTRQAMDMIIAELGEDALILGSRKVPQSGFLGFLKKRGVEITAAYDPDKISFSGPVAALFDRMLDSQVNEELAREIAGDTENSLKTQPGADAHEVTRRIISQLLGAPAPIKLKKRSRKIVLFIGPTGAGKTTSTVKIAANFAIKQQKKVGIINTDTFRVGAREQLMTYADIIGLPLHVVSAPEELGSVLAELKDRDVILIDTAGKRPGDERHKDDILGIIAQSKPQDILVCMPASLSFPAAEEILDTYSFLPDYRLLITKLDETRRRGLPLNLRRHTGKPIAYVTTGQNVPDDIEVMNAETLANEILGGDR